MSHCLSNYVETLIPRASLSVYVCCHKTGAVEPIDKSEFVGVNGAY